MNIILNGAAKTVREPLTVSGLLADLGINKDRVVVERNLQIVPRDEFDGTHLAGGDRLELLTLVSGG